MSFFLLGRVESGEVRLLSPKLFESRQDATSELSRLASDPSMADVEAEVYVADLNSATPVLLVRQPSAAGESSEEPLTDETVESAAVFEAPEEPLVEPVADEAIAESIVEAQEQAASELEPQDDLRTALQRTTAHMESTGIVAPESVGPEPSAEPVELVAETPEPLAEEQSEAAVAGEGAPLDSPAWPWDVSTPADAEAAVTEEAGEPALDTDEAAEPATEVAPFVLEGLEEPAPDDAGDLLGLSPDVALEAPRPVILGAYDEVPSVEAPELAETPAPGVPDEVSAALLEPAEPVEIEEAAGSAVTGVAEPMSAPDVEPVEDYDAAIAEALAAVETEASQEATTGPAETNDAISDFIMDLGSVTSVPEAVAEEPAAAPPSSSDARVTAVDTGSYTCEDCVYVETCPNKGQRAPKDCVSFQWK